MPSSHLILCRPLLLLPPIPPSIRVFSNESTLRMRWPKYWSFSFSICYLLLYVSCSVMSNSLYPMDCSLLGSSVRGILQARILGWVAISFSRASSQPRDWTWVSHFAGRFFTIWATRGILVNTCRLSPCHQIESPYTGYHGEYKAVWNGVILYCLSLSAPHQTSTSFLLNF